MRSKTAIDRGFIKSEDFGLINTRSTLFLQENSLYINFEIPHDKGIIFEESEKVFILIKCDETRLRYTEQLEVDGEILKFTIKIPVNRIGDECLFSVYGINENNIVIYKSHEYKAKVNKPKINIQTEWTSFKDHEEYQWKRFLFWVVEIIDHETIKIVFNEDIRGFKEFYVSKNVRLRDRQDFLWANIGLHLKTAQRFALEVDIARSEDDFIMSNYINSVGSNNFFFKIADINVDSTASDLDVQKRDAVFPYLKEDLEHKGQGNPWLWLADYLQSPIIPTLKKIINIKTLLGD